MTKEEQILSAKIVKAAISDAAFFVLSCVAAASSEFGVHVLHNENMLEVIGKAAENIANSSAVAAGLEEGEFLCQD